MAERRGRKVPTVNKGTVLVPGLASRRAATSGVASDIVTDTYSSQGDTTGCMRAQPVAKASHSVMAAGMTAMTTTCTRHHQVPASPPPPPQPPSLPTPLHRHQQQHHQRRRYHCITATRCTKRPARTARSARQAHTGSDTDRLKEAVTQRTARQWRSGDRLTQAETQTSAQTQALTLCGQ